MPSLQSVENGGLSPPEIPTNTRGVGPLTIPKSRNNYVTGESFEEKSSNQKILFEILKHVSYGNDKQNQRNFFVIMEKWLACVKIFLYSAERLRIVNFKFYKKVSLSTT